LSVYTSVGADELAAWLQPLQLGRLLEHVGIAAGIQNSNYFFTTASGRYVLTLFESLSPTQLEFYLALQSHLAKRGVPCPQPLTANDGQLWRPLCGKPAALLSCLPGAPVERVTLAQVQALGGQLAALHLAVADFPSVLPNPCGAAWRLQTGQRLLPLLDPAEQVLLADELAFQQAQDFSGLPQGVIHADLFRDNVLWDQFGALSGVLDFYFAGTDCLLFDLAVVANDWCSDAPALDALLTGYAAVRALTLAERQAWPAMRRAAALRFWLLRLEVRHQPRAGAVVTIKNPDDFRHLLSHLRLAEPGLRR
jgi:homoserine kinase type II